MWAAYIIQLGICFFAPILAALFRRLSERNLPPSCPGSHSSQSGGTSTQTDVEQKLSGSCLKNIEAAFITSLVDFQKAQCYYIMAIQVASITTLHNSAKGTVAYWQAVSTIVRAVPTLDIVASTLILLCLWILKQRSWYILLITLAASIISTYVFFDPRIMSVPDRLFEGPRHLNFTDKNTNPYSLCSVKPSGDNPRWHRMSTAWVFYLCVLILVFLIVDHIFSLRLPRAKDRPYFLSYSKFNAA